MNYKLAKQLKDAGFPQDTEKMINNKDLQKELEIQLLGLESGYIACPTLEELIDACGDKIHNLSRFDDDWMVNFRMLDGDLGQSKWDSQGKTPSEAVACLWLKLNK